MLLIAGIGNVSMAGFTGLAEANNNGNVEGLAALIFTRYLWAFELTGALLITAALGAMVLAHRERFEKAQDAARTRRGAVPAGRTSRRDCPIPVCSPGTTPSTSRRRLPDGSGSDISVSSDPAPTERARPDHEHRTVRGER